jgi:hypothetical protein
MADPPNVKPIIDRDFVGFGTSIARMYFFNRDGS